MCIVLVLLLDRYLRAIRLSGYSHRWWYVFARPLRMAAGCGSANGPLHLLVEPAAARHSAIARKIKQLF
jgi:hypothetical protein